MKRKLALMLTMTLLAGSLDSGMLVSAADFSAEESVEQAVEEEPQPTEENGAEELTDAESISQHGLLQPLLLRQSRLMIPEKMDQK